MLPLTQNANEFEQLPPENLKLHTMKASSNLTASTGTDSDEVKEDKPYQFESIYGKVVKDEKSYQSPTEVFTTAKILEKAKIAHKKEMMEMLDSDDSDDIPPLTAPDQKTGSAKVEMIKKIFKKMKHKANIKQDNIKLLDILKNSEHMKQKAAADKQFKYFSNPYQHVGELTKMNQVEKSKITSTDILSKQLTEQIMEESTKKLFNNVNLKEWKPPHYHTAFASMQNSKNDSPQDKKEDEMVDLSSLFNGHVIQVHFD